MVPEDVPNGIGIGEDCEDFVDDYEGTAQVLAFDPGGTTGWSLFEVAPEGISAREEHRQFPLLRNVVRWKHGQIDCGSQRGDLGTSGTGGNGGTRDVSGSGENAGLGEILGLIRSWPYAVVVIEDFVLDAKRFNTGRDLLSPVRLTAGISYDLWLQRRAYYSQSPSIAKTSATDEHLKNWGYYTSKGGLNHARDADRHALTFLRRAAVINAKGRALRQKAWPHLFGTYVSGGIEKKGEFYG